MARALAQILGDGAPRHAIHPRTEALLLAQLGSARCERTKTSWSTSSTSGEGTRRATKGRSRCSSSWCAERVTSLNIRRPLPGSSSGRSRTLAEPGLRASMVAETTCRSIAGARRPVGDEGAALRLRLDADGFEANLRERRWDLAHLRRLPTRSRSVPRPTSAGGPGSDPWRRRPRWRGAPRVEARGRPPETPRAC